MAANRASSLLRPEGVAEAVDVPGAVADATAAWVELVANIVENESEEEVQDALLADPVNGELVEQRIGVREKSVPPQLLI